MPNSPMQASGRGHLPHVPRTWCHFPFQTLLASNRAGKIEFVEHPWRFHFLDETAEGHQALIDRLSHFLQAIAVGKVVHKV